MRTTVNIDEALLAEAKVRASRAHRTIGDLLDDALRDYFARDHVTTAPPSLPDFGYSGAVHVDLYDKDALHALMDGDALP
ncbi:MAG: hypothetical protein QM572_14610 [Nocardioides sp.]|uniref:type II toxin-antitoxin system VapB family antitoxin n=1 Tax=Nocardioides sp. TaxID=35761 RepID=UPI0039E24737